MLDEIGLSQLKCVWCRPGDFDTQISVKLPLSYKAIIVGYAKNHSADTYRLYNPLKRLIVENRDVTWLDWTRLNPTRDLSIFAQEPELLHDQGIDNEEPPITTPDYNAPHVVPANDDDSVAGRMVPRVPRRMVPGVISQKITSLMSILPRVNQPRVNMFRANLGRVKSIKEMRNKIMFVLIRKLNILGMWTNIKDTPNMRQMDGV